MPSKEQVKLASPDAASEADPLKETELVYQPFEPAVPLNVPEMFGSTESTFAVNVPISELSPKEESAQYAKLLIPWLSGTLQLELMHPKVCPFKVPSIEKML